MARTVTSELLRRLAGVSPLPSAALNRMADLAPIPLSSRLLTTPILPRLYCSSSRETPSQHSPSIPNPLKLPLTRSKPMTRAMMRARGATPPDNTINDFIQKSRIYNLSIHRSLYPMKEAPKRKLKRIHLPTHYVEVSYKLRKAVVFYQPSIAHIPHGIKERNPVLVTSGVKRGQNT